MNRFRTSRLDGGSPGEHAGLSDTVRPPSRSLDTLLIRHYLLIRACWYLLVFASLCIFLASLPVYYQQLLMVCTSSACVPGQLEPERILLLRQLGLTIEVYALSVVSFNFATSLVWFAVGWLIFWRKARDWMALLLSLTFMVVGSACPGQTSLFGALPLHLINYLAVVLLFLVFCLFPNGRFVPRWMILAVVVYWVINLPNFFTDLLADISGWLLALYFLFSFSCISLLGVTQIYRYRRVSDPVEQQQIKWIIFSCVTIISGEIIFWTLTLLFPSLGQLASLYDLFFSPVTLVLILLIPVSLGFAILRYRLWDIDLIINRTLVYGSLTGVLVLVYVGGIIILSSLLHGFTGEAGESPLAVAGSTLVIAALFQPLRRSIQQVIDRRFYRSKYDASRTLLAFSATVRNEVDLDTLSSRLLEVVDDTMQPTHASLWLRFSETEASLPPTLPYEIASPGLLDEKLLLSAPDQDEA